MVTALALQLIQSVVTLPRHQTDNYSEDGQDDDSSFKRKKSSKHKHGQVCFVCIQSGTANTLEIQITSIFIYNDLYYNMGN